MTTTIYLTITVNSEFSGPEQDDTAAEGMLFLAGCLFLLGGFIMIPNGYGFV
jgi:hypothetical protein